MLTNKKIIWAGTILTLSVVGGGFWAFSRQPRPQTQSITKVKSANTSGSISLTPTTGGGISLQPKQPPAKDPNALNVTNNPSSGDLGQLTPNSETSANSANQSSAPKPLDPATFKEYEKYKDGNSALFGDMQPGTGDELAAGKKAAVYYRGWLTDGRLFDETRLDKDGKPEPFIFAMGGRQVIPGWEQGLSGMKVGGTRLLIVPPAVGYGAEGQASIPPNSVLVFQVQLLAVQ